MCDSIPGGLTLSAKGLTNLPRIYENDFTFRVGSRAYACPSFVAAFLSGRVAANQIIDPTVCEFIVDTPDPDRNFRDFISLGFGSSLIITSKTLSFFLSLGRELENHELLDYIIHSNEQDLTTENVIDRITYLITINHPYEAELAFCAANFHQFRVSQFRASEISVISSIMSHESFQINDEEFVFELITNLVRENLDYFPLYKHVRFEYLEQESLVSFLAIVSSSFDCLTFQVWNALSPRLLLSVSKKPSRKRSDGPHETINCSFVEGDSLGGIISYLTREYKCHVEDTGFVSLIASRICNPGSYPLRTIADFTNGSGTSTIAEPNSWIGYDFKEMRVTPTHYSLRARIDREGYWLRSWVLEGSLDGGTSWIELDQKRQNMGMNARGAIVTFQVAHQSEVQMIRIRQTGTNSHGTHQMLLNAIEIFGVLTR
jgi:hypothetical protein